MSSPIDRLQKFKEKISKATIFDKEIAEYIAIEVYDYITKDNETLKNAFHERLHYLENLAKSKDFNEFQDTFFETIQKILDLTTYEEVEELQKEFANQILARFKGHSDFKTLPEIYKILRSKENYYRLGDHSYFSPEDGEISVRTHIVPIRKQYEIINRFLEMIVRMVAEKHPELTQKIEELCQLFNQALGVLEEKLYRIPKKLHFKEFDDFFTFCARAFPQEGYEYLHTFTKDEFYQRNTAKRLEGIRQDAAVVLDDLIEELEKTTPVPHHIKSTGIILYNFTEHSSPASGTLHIGNFAPLQFNKIPAQILRFFYSVKSLDNKYTTFHDFNRFNKQHDEANQSLINSDSFRRKVDEINNRIKEASKGLMEELITKEATANKRKATLYRWNEQYL